MWAISAVGLAEHDWAVCPCPAVSCLIVTSDDPYLPLAFSLASNPGAYAVLAGAGISKGAGLPSAWDIEVDLVRKIAQRDKAGIVIDDSNAEGWYEENYGKQLTYSSVIEDVAPLPHERQALLQRYFESAGDDDQASVPIPPSAAHRAIAQLVALGIIRVVVTMNFDRLFEQALTERGIQPTIVATAHGRPATLLPRRLRPPRGRLVCSARHRTARSHDGILHQTVHHGLG